MKKTLIAATLVALLVAVFATTALTLESQGRHCKNDPSYGNYRDNILLERKGNEPVRHHIRQGWRRLHKRLGLSA